RAGRAADWARNRRVRRGSLRILLEEERSGAFGHAGGADDRGEAPRERAPCPARQRLDRGDQPLLDGHRGAPDQAPALPGEGDLHAAGVLPRLATERQSAPDELAHDDGDRALVGQGARGELVDRVAVRLAELLEDVELRAAETELFLRNPGRDAERA